MIDDRLLTFLSSRARHLPANFECLRASVAARTGWLLAAVVLLASAVYGEDWPQWLGPRRDGVWRETGILKRFPTNGASIRWRVSIGAGYSGPSIAGGRVYLPTGNANGHSAQGSLSVFER